MNSSNQQTIMPPQQQQQHLKDLLLQNQEPFHLPNYIADRRLHLIPKNASFCKNPGSPLGRISNGLFLHVPAKTAALLLEAAMRIQKQNLKPKPKPKPKSQASNTGFGILRSVLKSLKIRSLSRNRENGIAEAEGDAETGVCIGRLSGGVRFGIKKSMNLDGRWSRSYRRREEDDDDHGGGGCGLLFDEIEIAKAEKENGDFQFSFSPFSPPFRSALHSRADSTVSRSPCFVSPATSPPRRLLQENSSGDEESSLRFQTDKDEEEDKDQNSPVSVLDPPFEDDDDGPGEEEDEHEEDEEEEIYNGYYDLECSYAFVQRAKNKLLNKLCRFEKLAELDPLELEKRILEEEGDDDDDNNNNDDDESLALEEEEEEEKETMIKAASLLTDVFSQKPCMKRLISDLINEEEDDERSLMKQSNDGQEAAIKRVCKRLETWQTVKPNTIDMMINMDLRRESDHWTKPAQHIITRVAMEVEADIFLLLLQEMVEDLI
ncbi:hypothetical protein Dimus_034727 [Dionaea muscipula]